MIRALIPVLLAAALAGCAMPDWLREALPGMEHEPGPPEALIDPAPMTGVPYDATIVGVEDDALRDALEETSLLVEFEDRPPASLSALRRRIEADRDRLLTALRARGHYGGEVETEVDEEAAPIRIVMRVTPGPVFTLSAFNVESANPDPTGAPIGVPLAELDIETGMPALADAILEGERRLILAFAARGYPLAAVVDSQGVVDHAARTVAYQVTVDTGRFARFGATEIVGLAAVAPRFVERRIAWRRGEPFDLRRLEETREDLVASGLFRSVRIEHAEAVGPDGLLPTRVELEERPHRSIGGGVNYSTAEGFGAELFWEHRNIFDAGERLRLGTNYSQLAQAARASYRDPRILGFAPDLVADVELRREQTEAFDEQSVAAEIGLEWPLFEVWRLTTAISAQRVLEDEQGQERLFTLVSTPVRLRRDTTDDLLDPTRGGRLSLGFAPFLRQLGSDVAFARVELGDTIYFKLRDEEPRIVWAGWANLGTMYGAELDDIPAKERFYAGGGGSVRGFGHQLAGPVDAQGDPIGGRSLIAFGTELRLQVTETIGVVPFLEAGNVYRERVPSLDEGFFWGAGLGLRYFTGIGPIRADLAFPLNPRGVDDKFQIYISLGQAF